jgi:hypothetical protein
VGPIPVRTNKEALVEDREKLDTGRAEDSEVEGHKFSSDEPTGDDDVEAHRFEDNQVRDDQVRED